MNRFIDKIPPEQIELLVLRAMCQGTPQGSVRANAASLLGNYAWREPVHQAMFSCLLVIPSVEPDHLRRALLACLTRKGFPDIDLEILFEPVGLSSDEVEELIRQLKTSS